MKKLLFVLCLSLIGCTNPYKQEYAWGADKLPAGFNNGTDSHVEGMGQSWPLPSKPGKKGEILDWRCDHHWSKSKYWITTTGSNEEPQFYPPSALMPVEICKKCGMLRIPPKQLGSKDFDTLAEEAAKETDEKLKPELDHILRKEKGINPREPKK